MKKLLLLLIILTTLTNVSFASFPVVTEVSNEPDSTLERVMQSLLFIVLVFIAYQISIIYLEL